MAEAIITAVATAIITGVEHGIDPDQGIFRRFSHTQPNWRMMSLTNRSLKMKRILTAAALMAVLAIPATAFAHVSVGVGINLGAPGYYGPAYVAPPPPVYYYPPPAVYAPPPVVYGPPYNPYYRPYPRCWWRHGYRVCR